MKQPTLDEYIARLRSVKDHPDTRYLSEYYRMLAAGDAKTSKIPPSIITLAAKTMEVIFQHIYTEKSRTAAAENLVKYLSDRNEIVKEDDGYVYYCPNEYGSLSAQNLRDLADELDLRNQEWDATVKRELNGK